MSSNFLSHLFCSTPYSIDKNLPYVNLFNSNLIFSLLLFSFLKYIYIYIYIYIKTQTISTSQPPPLFLHQHHQPLPTPPRGDHQRHKWPPTPAGQPSTTIDCQLPKMKLKNNQHIPHQSPPVHHSCSAPPGRDGYAINAALLPWYRPWI